MHKEKVSRSKSYLALDQIEDHAKILLKRIEEFRKIFVPSSLRVGYVIYHDPSDEDIEDLFFDLNQSIENLMKWYEVNIYY